MEGIYQDDLNLGQGNYSEHPDRGSSLRGPSTGMGEIRGEVSGNRTGNPRSQLPENVNLASMGESQAFAEHDDTDNNSEVMTDEELEMIQSLNQSSALLDQERGTGPVNSAARIPNSSANVGSLASVQGSNQTTARNLQLYGGHIVNPGRLGGMQSPNSRS